MVDGLVHTYCKLEGIKKFTYFDVGGMMDVDTLRDYMEALKNEVANLHSLKKEVANTHSLKEDVEAIKEQLRKISAAGKYNLIIIRHFNIV